jgi:hypothetical protein
MITINPLDLLFLILAIMALPIGIMFTMILWRVYRMLDRVEKLLDAGLKIIDIIQNVDKIPMMLLNKFLGK